MTEQPGGPSERAREAAETIRRECVRLGPIEVGDLEVLSEWEWNDQHAADVIQRAIDAALAEREAEVGRVVDAMDAMVASCCGDDRERFCEQYGCGTLRVLADRLRAALAAPGQEGDRDRA